MRDLVTSNRLYLFDFDYFHQTGYHWAAKRGYLELLKLLISKGVHINQYDNTRRTPLWLAAKNNHLSICQILLENKANPFMDSKDGKKPIDVTTDLHIKKLLGDYMEANNYMNGRNFFKINVMKKNKETMVNLFQLKGKERIHRKIEENLKGISKSSMNNI